MDKYQKFFFKKLNFITRRFESNQYKYDKFNASYGLKYNNETFEIEQKQYGENDVELAVIINGVQKRYSCIYDYPTFLTGVYVSRDGKKYEKLEEETMNGSKIYATVIDFKYPIKFIKLTIEDNMADDIIIPFHAIEYGEERHQKEMDEARCAKEEERKKERQAELLKNAAVEHSKGQSLINVYFQPCCSEYRYSEITLFRAGKVLETIRVEGKFYHAFVNLAYGRYSFVIKQFDKNAKLLLETNPKEVHLFNEEEWSLFDRHPSGI